MSLAYHPTLLREACLYFAKFPLLDGAVSSMFRTGRSSVAGYDAFKASMQAMPENSLIPDIKNYLFSANEEKLKSEIEDTKGIFLLLDYGQLSSSTDSLKRQNDEFELGIIIAQKLNPLDYDMAEVLLIQDQLLNLMRQIREQMLADSKCSPFVKQLALPHQINPWYARDLHNATGSSMVFAKTGIDLM